MECQLACVHIIQIIDVQMELSVVMGVSFMGTYKRVNLSAIIHEASTSITTTSFMVRTIVHHMVRGEGGGGGGGGRGGYTHVQCTRFKVHFALNLFSLNL